jgi:hemerythrin superfamily protein
MLREQHEEIRRRIEAVRNATGDSRLEEFEPLVRLLAVHETSEEEVVYPALARHNPELAAVVEDRKQEEDEAKKTLADLEGMDVSTVEFLAAFVRFADDVEEHAAAEESSVFPALELLEDRDALTSMGTALTAAQALAPTHAHRAAPEGALANMVVGPFVAVVDRVRDVIRDAAR